MKRFLTGLAVLAAQSLLEGLYFFLQHLDFRLDRGDALDILNRRFHFVVDKFLTWPSSRAPLVTRSRRASEPS